MINRAGNKEKAKRVLNENGNLSGMVGMEILYRVIAAITSVLLGAMIAGGIGVVSAVVSAPFKLFGLAGIIIAYVLITPIATLVGAIAGGAVAGPFEVARYRYYLSLRKNGIRPKVTCIFDAFDFFMQFALVTGVRMLTIMWIPVLIQFATLLLAAVVAAASRSYLAAMLLVMIGMIAALVVAAYRSYQFWPMALVQADHPQLNAEQVMERCKVMTEGHKFDLFVFDLSYLGWNILSLLTGGILSVLYVAPYKMIATAFVYEEMKGRPVMVDDIKPSTDGNGMTIAVDPKKLMGLAAPVERSRLLISRLLPELREQLWRGSPVCMRARAIHWSRTSRSFWAETLPMRRSCFLRVRRRSAAATVRSCSTVRFRNIVLPIFPATAPT